MTSILSIVQYDSAQLTHSPHLPVSEAGIVTGSAVNISDIWQQNVRLQRLI